MEYVFGGNISLRRAGCSRLVEAKIEKQWAENALAVVEAVTVSAAARGVRAKVVTTKSDLVAESIIAAAKKGYDDTKVRYLR